MFIKVPRIRAPNHERDQQMECVTCGRQAEPNRAVVDHVAGEIAGVLCPACETELFGDSLDEPCWNMTETCVLCQRDGFYELPKLGVELADREAADAGEAFAVRLRTDEPTPEMCDEHFHRTLRDDSADAESRELQLHGP